MTIEKLHDTHRIELGITVTANRPSAEQVDMLVTQLLSAMSDREVCSKGDVLQWTHITLALKVNGVEFNNKGFINPDMCFTIQDGRDYTEIHWQLLYMILDKDCHNRFMSLSGNVDRAIQYRDNALASAVNAAVRTLLDTTYFLLAV